MTAIWQDLSDATGAPSVEDALTELNAALRDYEILRQTAEDATDVRLAAEAAEREAFDAARKTQVRADRAIVLYRLALVKAIHE